MPKVTIHYPIEGNNRTFVLTEKETIATINTINNMMNHPDNAVERIKITVK